MPPPRLTERQARILREVVQEHCATQRPVGSKALLARGTVESSSSTVRHELNTLEQLGLLTHPHTSAGRVPTDAGLRYYVDQLLRAPHTVDAHEVLPSPVVGARPRVDEALQQATESVSALTSLAALATAPPAEGTTIRHIEVLLLQPQVIAVVVITASGDVTRRIIPLERPADPGLVDWAASYLNEQVTGTSLGASMLRKRLDAPDLRPIERQMLATLAPAFTELVDERDLVMDGTSNLARILDLRQLAALMAVLDERRRLLGTMRRLAGSGRVIVQIGSENELPELQSLALVGAPYGLPARTLGIVGVLGPKSMDYELSLHAVQAAAGGLSNVVEEMYTQ